MKTSLVLASLIVLAGVPVHAQCPLGEITSSDLAAGDGFGVSVAIDGTLAVVGASADDDLGDNSGSAYVFALVAGNWMEIQKLTAPDGAAQDRFGYSVSLSGESILIGAYADDDGGTNAGSAYVYDRTPMGWTLTTKLTASDPEDYDQFGRSVSVSGDRLVVGAYLEDQMGVNAGAAYVFELGQSGWTEVNKLVAADGANEDRFGSSVGISGDWLIVGSPLDDLAQSDRGSAYVFGWSQFGWFLDQKLTSIQGSTSDRFGGAVAIDGTTVLVGAHLVDDNGGNSGKAYLYERQAQTWQQVADLAPTDPMPDDQFGSSVAVDGLICLVGALGRDEGGSNSGAGFLFEDSGSGWVLTEKYVAIDSGTNDQLGRVAALSGVIALMGSSSHDSGGLSSAGAVYYFRGTQLVVPYCLCGSGEPCGNPDDDAGCAHFAGSGSRLIACGTTRVSADDLIMTVSNAPPNQFGIVYMGGASMPAVPFGDGHRCVGGAQVFRFPVRFSGPQGGFDEGPDIVAFSASNFPSSGHIDAGETWYFQGWFRDPLGPCGTGFNLSNALAITFVP